MQPLLYTPVDNKHDIIKTLVSLLLGVKLRNVMDEIVVNGTEYHEGYFINSRKYRNIEGKLLTTMELLGLPEQQSEALKSEVRNILWGRGILSYGLHFNADEIAELAEKKYNPEGKDRSIKI